MEYDYYNYAGTKGYGHSTIYHAKKYLDLLPEWTIVSVIDATTLTIRPRQGWAMMLYNKEEDDYCWIHCDFYPDQKEEFILWLKNHNFEDYKKIR